VVRGGVATCMGEPACPISPPSVTAVDFTALYKRCMESGLKARVVFNHAADLQTITLTCSLPTSSTSTATAGRRCHRQCRNRRARAVTAATENQLRLQPPSPDAAVPACENAPLLCTASAATPSPDAAVTACENAPLLCTTSAATPPSLSPPEAIPPPAK
jgi:hypothetical protein